MTSGIGHRRTCDPDDQPISSGTYLYCPDGSHLAMYDDQVTYFDGIVDFIRNVGRGTVSSD